MWVGRIITQEEKNLEGTVECDSGGNILLLYKVLHFLFFPLAWILCALCLMIEKIINMVLMRDLRKFSFFGRGEVSPTHSELCWFVSGSQAKHQVSSPIMILLKKFLSASTIAIISWQDVTWSTLFSGVKECGTKRAHNFLFSQILFQNPRNYSLGDVQRFCYHSWCNLIVIFYQIKNNSNVNLI